MTANRQALAGIKVLDVSGTVATGYCGKLFADHGATVIDVESARGFPTRYLHPWVSGASAPERSALHRWLSASKSSVVLDIADPAQRTRFLTLAADANVVLSADLPEALERTHCARSVLNAAAPNLLLSHITWFGLDGPYAHFAAVDGTIQSLAGLVKGVGLPEGPPLLPTGYQAQVIGGLTAFIGTLSRVLARELGNDQGFTRLDTSIFEANLCFTEVGTVGSYEMDVVGQRLGINRLPPTYPLGVFPCADGWIGLTVLTPSQWHSFCRLLEIDDLAHVPEYQTALGRYERAAVIEPRFVEKVKHWKAEELFNRAQRLRVPLALVPTMEQLFSVDQYVERGAFAAIDQADGRAFQAPVTPFRLYGSPALPPARPPQLGEHTATWLAAPSSVGAG